MQWSGARERGKERAAAGERCVKERAKKSHHTLGTCSRSSERGGCKQVEAGRRERSARRNNCKNQRGSGASPLPASRHAATGRRRICVALSVARAYIKENRVRVSESEWMNETTVTHLARVKFSKTKQMNLSAVGTVQMRCAVFPGGLGVVGNTAERPTRASRPRRAELVRARAQIIEARQRAVMSQLHADGAAQLDRWEARFAAPSTIHSAAAPSYRGTPSMRVGVGFAERRLNSGPFGREPPNKTSIRRGAQRRATKPPLPRFPAAARSNALAASPTPPAPAPSPAPSLAQLDLNFASTGASLEGFGPWDALSPSQSPMPLGSAAPCADVDLRGCSPSPEARARRARAKAQARVRARRRAR